MIVTRERRESVLLALRKGPRTEAELARELDWPAATVHATCRVLAERREVEVEVAAIVRGRRVLVGASRWQLPG